MQTGSCVNLAHLNAVLSSGISSSWFRSISNVSILLFLQRFLVNVLLDTVWEDFNLASSQGVVNPHKWIGN